MWNPLKHLPNKHIDEFSRSLARELSERFPLELESQTSNKKSDKKLGKALNGIYSKARDFRVDNKLGVYGKARLGNTFRWELKEMGYGGGFVEEATKGLVVSISRG